MNYDIILKNSINYSCEYSIIIPTHNSEKYILNIVNDILNQTNKNFELIIIDDCSNDNTLSLLSEKLKNNKTINYVIINTKQNIGAGIARNIGIENASGEYVIFIDSDDSIINSLVEELENINNLNLDMILYGFNEKYIKNNKIVFNKNICYKNSLSNRMLEKKEFDNNIAYFENITALGYIWNKCYKKCIIDKYNIRFEDEILYEDLFFNLNYIEYIDKIYILNKSMYTYNNFIDSKSITKSDHYNYYKLSNEKIDRLKNYIIKHNIKNEDATLMIDNLKKRYKVSYIVRQFESKNYLFKNSKYKINIFEYIYCMIVYLVKKFFYLFYLKFAK